MLKKIYIGNLPFTATESEVRAIFARYGIVYRVDLITDRETGQPRGFGFVEMETKQARTAAYALNGISFGDRQIFVKPAKERTLGAGIDRKKLTW